MPDRPRFSSIGSLFSLKGKTAVVTGATGYFGAAFSECLLSAGADVILFGRSAGKLEKLAKSLKATHKKAKVTQYKADFYSENDYRKALIDAARKNKSIDILVNNAFDFSKDTGFNDPSGKAEKMSKSQWMKSLESGVYWSALAIQVIGEKMKGQKSGSIINISSMYALVSPDPGIYKGTEMFNPPAYSVSKAGIAALTRYIASFYGEHGIRCNSILPGAFPNLEGSSYNSPKDEGFLKRLRDKTVLGRFGRPEDLKGALVFLSADSSDYITGQSIIVDGGWTIR
ncbi:MAG: SDR family oxidoreductase [Thermodesulfovibrionales bacterium]|nr:SDR family oxidoreductase [Thermodesulfovibrionales bacterium]